MTYATCLTSASSHFMYDHPNLMISFRTSTISPGTVLISWYVNCKIAMLMLLLTAVIDAELACSAIIGPQIRCCIIIISRFISTFLPTLSVNSLVAIVSNTYSFPLESVVLSRINSETAINNLKLVDADVATFVTFVVVVVIVVVVVGLFDQVAVVDTLIIIGY
ncbi:hypothetical protein AX774_g6111 [Zancudomyces culisetae]|uniref:Uncharacterized protein n=1 Tax=Zancudomyces culisetae TaxID=1213189 RepID=A0A1R1PHK0_ZANCU|nr:hypothetical protein AX774_g6111 [Zancudomyces culisetae]|eukprot:OMH80454.1 hypothetical protein AX774_g6111 [Zancudomyces culisetae]